MAKFQIKVSQQIGVPKFSPVYTVVDGSSQQIGHVLSMGINNGQVTMEAASYIDQALRDQLGFQKNGLKGIMPDEYEIIRTA